jgi:hypothetical protein
MTSFSKKKQKIFAMRFRNLLRIARVVIMIRLKRERAVKK